MRILPLSASIQHFDLRMEIFSVARVHLLQYYTCQTKCVARKFLFYMPVFSRLIAVFTPIYAQQLEWMLLFIR